jgi:hypothetical protein
MRIRRRLPSVSMMKHDETPGRSPIKYKKAASFRQNSMYTAHKSISQTYHSTQTNTTVDACITFAERMVWWKRAHWKARAPRFTLHKGCIKKIHKTYRFLVDMTRVTSNVKGFKIKLQNLFLFPSRNHTPNLQKAVRYMSLRYMVGASHCTFLRSRLMTCSVPTVWNDA